MSKNTIALPTTEEINEMPMKDLAIVYNEVVEALKDPKYGEVRKFRDRPTGIKRVTDIVEAYVSKSGATKPANKVVEFTPKKGKAPAKKPTAKTSAPKAPKPKTVRKGKFSDDTIFEHGPNEPREGTALRIIWDFIADNEVEDCTAAALAEYFRKNYKPKSRIDEIDLAFAKGYVGGAIRKGTIVEYDDL